ncbi:hypothetical protein SPRG_07115 [Saprolegnia parasitica CBS 223.65]|uniref:Uncharacterized protein n=1 Tax=Saprolegnia parasitica (strain CBS 223.65) TaxID=695850 RepID=A0A067CLZ2_SAPPC|nr:hypothetical protein SPRG_07115 [Saprolegnia parasitica CBS 223.65]KDO27842.1 hypothetical protein SPRG_07115 [Saprolegnia parasitica CBS 223.65]|eukprot:XP_012201302.1 hypothetical protein SPRG_07115 [Saprolegnia parasitica CBS 223.65]
MAAPTSSSKYGNLSMRNIMIRKKLEERKRFDSADYAMQKAGKPALEIATAIESPRAADVLSPAHLGMVAFRNSMVDTDMTAEPSMTLVAKDVPSKYGALTARNIILRRKLTDRTKFDSADYQLKKLGVTSDVIGADQVDVDMTAGNDDQDVDMGSGATMSPRVTMAKPQSPRPMSPAMPTSPSNKYGKMCAANILIRKKLKERKRFDSADYSMERQGKKKASMEDATPVPYLQATSMETSDSDVHSPVTKQMKLTRVAGRNIFLQRKLPDHFKPSF